jgi:hypothetical protein
MDGINPTLAFAALFFGMSGAHNATQDSPTQSELQSLIDCPALMLTASSAPDTWTKVFEDSLTDFDLAPAPTNGLEEPADASGLLQRQIVPVATMITTAPEADPCDPAQ